MRINKLYMFYPSGSAGGAEYLMLRAAYLLSQNFHVVILDFVGGWLYEQANSVGLDVKLIQADRRYDIESNAVILTPASSYKLVKKIFNDVDDSILLWNLHPYNLIPSVYRLRNLPEVFRKGLLGWFASWLLNLNYRHLVRSLTKNNKIAVMDGACAQALQKYYGASNISYLPVYCPNEMFVYSKLGVNRPSLSQHINVVWLGRIDLDFKIHILRRLYDDLLKYSNESSGSIEFTVVGVGQGLELIQKEFKRNDNLIINFVGLKTGKELTDIIDNSDIGFAMGASAVELAARGLPTILLDFSYTEIPKNYRYNWLFNSSNYTLGRDIDNLSLFSGMSILDVMVLLKSDWKRFSIECFNYAFYNHSEASFLSLFSDFLSKSCFHDK